MNTPASGKPSGEGVFCTAGDLLTLVSRRYKQPAWTTLGEVRDGTGYATKGQSADAMAFGTWPSRGLRIIGFEFKSYRSDWLRELKNPQKAESLCGFCDEWWLVTGSDGVAKLEEIPHSWGWAIGTNKGLVTVKEPVAQDPKPISRIFLMSIIRNVSQSYVPASELEKLSNEKVTKMQKELADRQAYETKDSMAELEKLRTRLNEFEQASGIKIDRWDGGKEVGEIVKLILSTHLTWSIKQVHEATEKCRKLLTEIETLPFFVRS